MYVRSKRCLFWNNFLQRTWLRLKMRRLAKFLSLSLHEKQLFFEAFGLLLLSHICVNLIAFRHIYRFLSALSDETTVQSSSYDVQIFKQSVLRAASLLPWKSLCLSRSI